MTYGLVGGEADKARMVANARAVLAALPNSNWFKRAEADLYLDHENLGDSGVFDLLLRRELQDERHEQSLHLQASGRLLSQNLFEEDAFVCHVLIDNPEPVRSGGNDEAVVQLSQGAQITNADH